MTDNRTIKQRSYNMSRIHSKDTSPELIVRKFLFSKGIRYRIHVSTLSGKPDIVIRKLKIIIFINGCFWHGHKECVLAKIPKSNTDFWIDKIKNNIMRDAKNNTNLKNSGWDLITIWECELTSMNKEKTLNKLMKFLKFSQKYQ